MARTAAPAAAEHRSTTAGPSATPRDENLARTLTTVVAATFLLVGVLGFIPGITSNFDEMAFAGPDSQAELLGLFQVSILHNIVHLLFGVVGLWAARRGGRTSVLYLVIGGLTYLLLAAYGAAVGHDHDANFVPVNSADDWLHLGLAVGMLGLGAFLAGAGRNQRLPHQP